MGLSHQIAKLRTAKGLSQEKFAEILGVSRQAVQKWESGTTQPEIANIIAVSNYFNVSADKLLFGKESSFDINRNTTPTPDYENLHLWESYSQAIKLEYRQSLEEGKDIKQYEQLFSAVYRLPFGDDKEKICDVLYNIAQNAPMRTDFPYVEPSSYEEIQGCKSGSDYSLLARPDRAAMHSKYAGAWYGRIAGCLLGKPVECIKTPELIKLLKASDNYPLKRYINKADITPEMKDQLTYVYIDNNFYGDCIDCAPSDDDTNYTVMSTLLLYRNGRNFTPTDVLKLWLDQQPKTAYCTAERVAFLNANRGLVPPDTATYKNVFREWIGAQIRGDYYGYINPADPVTAANMAWRDASISHTKNGIYGEMWVSAMLSVAACTDDMEQIIKVGLGEIPQKSRLYEAITNILKMKHDGKTADQVYADIHSRWDEFNAHDWCHTISNAEIVAASLLYGNGDYSKSICFAVQAGFDTDCNGATVGSVVGMAKGIEAIDEQWLESINGKLRTNMCSKALVSVDSLISDTLRDAGY